MNFKALACWTLSLLVGIYFIQRGPASANRSAQQQRREPIAAQPSTTSQTVTSDRPAQAIDETTERTIQTLNEYERTLQEQAQKSDDISSREISQAVEQSAQQLERLSSEVKGSLEGQQK